MIMENEMKFFFFIFWKFLNFFWNYFGFFLVFKYYNVEW